MKELLHGTYLSLIGLLLLGYVLGDRGFAHLGVSSLYVGDMVLAASLVLFLIQPDIGPARRSPALWVLLLLDLWCFIRTVPYLGEYGVEALQDAALYAYSAFTILVCAALANPALTEKLCTLYGRAMTVSVILMPGLLLLSPTAQVSQVEIPLIFIKPGDAAVHLAGIAVFRLLGLHRPAPKPGGLDRMIDGVFWLCWMAMAIWSCSASRGSLLALACAVTVILAFGFARRRIAAFFVAVAVVVAALGILDVRIEGERRDISVEQLIDNAASILDSEGTTSGDLENTARWRLQWWGDILDYTIFGDDFWTGRGFGINLAAVDRYQDPNGLLRSPHNGNLTFLARAGVPGLALWLGFVAILSVGLVRAARASARQDLPNWQRLYVWILAYLVAALVNASFDVYLEGPQGGIWFWCIAGVGIATMRQGPGQARQPAAA